jgi:hypothetical protein
MFLSLKELYYSCLLWSSRTAKLEGSAELIIVFPNGPDYFPLDYKLFSLLADWGNSPSINLDQSLLW